MSYEFIAVEQKGRVGVITLNRPKQLNALRPGLMKELGQALAALRAAGRPIPTNDLWIAALARQHRLPLLTFDLHFAAVPRLSVLHPGTRQA